MFGFSQTQISTKNWLHNHSKTLIARFTGPTWGPPGADRTQLGPMLAPWNLLSGTFWVLPKPIKRRRYNLTTSVIGWAHVPNDPWKIFFTWDTAVQDLHIFPRVRTKLSIIAADIRDGTGSGAMACPEQEHYGFVASVGPNVLSRRVRAYRTIRLSTTPVCISHVNDSIRTV